MLRSLQKLSGVVVVGLLIGGPVAFALHVEHAMRNFRVVRAGVLYRSGQLTLDGLQRVVNDYGIRTVVTLRDAAVPGERPPDYAEEKYCRKEDIGYVRIPPAYWWSPVPPPPADEGVRRFREVMADPRNYPVLLHCCAGIHRTGAYCAVYHMEFDHWTNEAAIADLEVNGYDNLPDEWDILGYLEEYRPTWMGPSEPATAAEAPHKRRPPHKPTHAP